jgi:phage gp37-like protein
LSAVALLDQAVAFVRASFTRQQVATVRQYAGEFSAAEIPKLSYNCPAILITILGWKKPEAGGRLTGRHAKNYRLAAFVLCKNAKSREARMAEAMSLAEALSVVLRQWAPMTQAPYAAALAALKVTVLGLDDEANAENLYSGAVDKAGQALWMVDWYQCARGVIPLGPVRPAIPYEDLPALGEVVIEDSVHVNQIPPVPPSGDAVPTVTEKIDFVNP